jgi:hypothetical protein
MQIIPRSAKIRWESDLILQIENRFRPFGLGDSEVVYMDLYPNRWDLVNQI